MGDELSALNHIHAINDHGRRFKFGCPHHETGDIGKNAFWAGTWNWKFGRVNLNEISARRRRRQLS
jgi:hypothetical protein